MGRWANQNAYDELIRAAIASFPVAVPESLVKAVIAHESGFNPLAIRKEAPRPTLPPTPDYPNGGDESRGLMQLLVRTARALGYAGPPDGLYKPDVNIVLGVRLLAENLARAQGKVDVALSAYNGGWSSARANDARRVGGPDSPFVNQDYVDRVLSYADYFKGLEPPTHDTPPPSSVAIIWPKEISPYLIVGGVAVLVGVAWWLTHR